MELTEGLVGPGGGERQRTNGLGCTGVRAESRTGTRIGGGVDPVIGVGAKKRVEVEEKRADSGVCR